mmetsp:Transcript_10931/g.16595  ORF Transcript_10931/g.16595 Transcript_10931/m.16595 type:complete len:137 (+) Transcript_10931:5318-5728(+)
MVDYQGDKFRVNNQGDDFDFSQGALNETGRPSYSAVRTSNEDIHSDSIGEYKSEFVRIKFAPEQAPEEDYKENLEIEKIDLNDASYATHVLRTGKNLEKLFLAVRLQNFKKVLTIRTQFALVNRTSYDYLVHLQFK